MAKKKRSTKRGFNMSAAVRDILSENRSLTGKEVQEELKKRYPGQKINANSCGVAFSMARKKLGITKGKRKSVRKRRPSARRASSAGALDMSTLQAARKYVSDVGDVDKALDAVRQLKTLQIG